MEQKTTNRGFRLVEFDDDNGEGCSLQESSAARESGLIWLGIKEAWPKVFRPHAGGWSDVERPPLGPDDYFLTCGRMHLTQESVVALLPYLTYFAETGYLPDEMQTNEPTERDDR